MVRMVPSLRFRMMAIAALVFAWANDCHPNTAERGRATSRFFWRNRAYSRTRKLCDRERSLPRERRFFRNATRMRRGKAAPDGGDPARWRGSAVGRDRVSPRDSSKAARGCGRSARDRADPGRLCDGTAQRKKKAARLSRKTGQRFLNAAKGSGRTVHFRGVPAQVCGEPVQVYAAPGQ